MSKSRTTDIIRAEMAEVEAARSKLRSMLGRTMRVIKAVRFKPTDAEGKLHPVFKELRSHEATLRSADRHMARLRAEETAMLKIAAPAADSWTEFSQ